jgi:hypothetical protein
MYFYIKNYKTTIVIIKRISWTILENKKILLLCSD